MKKRLDMKERHSPLATWIYGWRADQRNEKRQQADGFEAEPGQLEKGLIPSFEKKLSVCVTKAERQGQGFFYEWLFPPKMF